MCAAKLFLKLEKNVHLRYTFWVVDSQKTPSNRHVHQGIQTSQQRQRACKPGETNLRISTAGE